ncbi:MAG: hypothetical protein DSY80_09995, partial [Desulfocapsa sp.]
ESSPGEKKTAPCASTVQENSPQSPSGKSVGRFRGQYRLLILCIAGAAILGGIILLKPADKISSLTAVRVAPEHTAPGMPFPVMIHIHSDALDSKMPVLIREKISAECRAEALTSGEKRREFNSQPRWIGYLKNGDAYFGYMVYPVHTLIPGKTIQFSGNVAVKSGVSNTREITGITKVSIAPYHWADTDKNYTISNDEILLAYEKYTGDEGGVKLDMLEQLWLSGKYSWNGSQSVFEPLNEE